MRPLTVNEPIDSAKLTINPGLLPPVVQHDPPDVEEVTQLVDAFFAQLKWEEPGVHTGSGEVKDAKGRQSLTHEGEEDHPTGESPVAESASPRSAVNVSVERDSGGGRFL